VNCPTTWKSEIYEQQGDVSIWAPIIAPGLDVRFSVERGYVTMCLRLDHFNMVSPKFHVLSEPFRFLTDLEVPPSWPSLSPTYHKVHSSTTPMNAV